jgi:lipopolysaccharide/colanic/teichoic acid biosynthesis glycosyltransferase
MKPRPMARKVKWIFDRTAALVLIVLSSPAVAAASAWILLDDGRPILFVQLRAGRNGKPFKMLKFRTMVNDAIEIGRRMNLSEDPFGIIRDDPRVTSSGRFLRRTGLDELPQLFNVLTGQMSLVGPRPDLVEQATNYTESDRRRLRVLPGITGWAQVNGRDELRWPERIRQDIWYIENWSLALDAKILLMTVSQFFRPEPMPIEDTMNIERAKKSKNDQ